MTGLVEKLCSVLECTPDELNDRLKNDQNILEQMKSWEMTYMCRNICIEGFTNNPANKVRTQEGYTIEEYANKNSTGELKYPDLVCIWEWDDSNKKEMHDLIRVYPLSNVYVCP
jgi:hypothetical protein